MGINRRKSTERGHFDYGWLNTYHTFSFGNYYDREFVGFRTLQVINEDRLAPQKGFPLHSHKDMEILSLVLEGSLDHQDSLGQQSSIQAGNAQIMSAGTGITHSEYNASEQTPVHFLQIWIIPDKKDYSPRYAEKSFQMHEKNETLLASPDGQNNSLIVHQDAYISHMHLKKSQKIIKTLSQARAAWIQMIQGEITLNGLSLNTGDGASIENVEQLVIEAITPSAFLFFDLS